MHALPVQTDVAAVYRTYGHCTEPIRVKYEDHFIFTADRGSVSTLKWEGEVYRNRRWENRSVAFLPANSELISDTSQDNKGVAVRLSNSLFVKAAQDHIDYSRISFRFADVTGKATQMLTNSLHQISTMEKFAHWPLLIETNALSLVVATIASLSPGATTAFKEKPYGFEGARRKRVFDHIESNINRQITLAELSDVAGLSQFHFARQFKQKLGMTPLAYLANKRVEMAKTAMRSKGVTLAQVALDCGFASQSHFTTCFKSVTGITPGAYRKQAA